jgi:hypothetical protein
MHLTFMVMGPILVMRAATVFFLLTGMVQAPMAGGAAIAVNHLWKITVEAPDRP